MEAFIIQGRRRSRRRSRCHRHRRCNQKPSRYIHIIMYDLIECIERMWYILHAVAYDVERIFIKLGRYVRAAPNSSRAVQFQSWIMILLEKILNHYSSFTDNAENNAKTHGDKYAVKPLLMVDSEKWNFKWLLEYSA